MRNARTPLLALSLLSLAPLAAQAGQAPAPVDHTIRVSAVDDKGQPVTGLVASDVALVQGGVAREVVALERDERPLVLAVLVDTSLPSGTAYRLNVVQAVQGLAAALPSGAKLTVWATGDRPEKLVEAADPAALASALRRAIPRGGNRLLDALVEASDAIKGREGERTAIVAITGVNVGFSDYDRRQVVDRVAGTGVVVYGLTFDEGRAPGSAESPADIGGSDYEYVLGELARRTSGRFDSTMSAMGVDHVLAGFTADLVAPYRLTWRGPADAKPKGLEVTVARPGVHVRVGGR